MLSLFYGVGISYILRYRSSNTSMVDMVNLSTPFVSPKHRFMEGTRLENRKNRNAEMVDLMFVLMFEILWIPPHDPRRLSVAFSQFEHAARALVISLHTVDFTTASGTELEELRRVAGLLTESVRHLQSERLFSQQQCGCALAQIQRIVAALHAVCL